MSDPIDIVERLREALAADAAIPNTTPNMPRSEKIDLAHRRASARLELEVACFNAAPVLLAEITRLRADFAALQHALVGDTGASAILTAQRLRAALAQPAAPTIEAARSMGAIGGPAVEAERLAFEAWMAGHCWKVGGRWDGCQYIGRGEAGGLIDAEAMDTRRLWAAWRDRAALAAAPQAPQPGAQGA